MISERISNHLFLLEVVSKDQCGNRITALILDYHDLFFTLSRKRKAAFFNPWIPEVILDKSQVQQMGGNSFPLNLEFYLKFSRDFLSPAHCSAVTRRRYHGFLYLDWN